MSDPAVETELKLLLTDAAVAALPLAAPLRDLPRRVVRLDATYFDTADCHLQQNGMALRLRRAARQWTQTLKAEGLAAPRDVNDAAPAAAGGLSARAEWEWPIVLRDGKPRIDRMRLRATPAGALLRANPKAGPLRAVFRVRVRRTSWDLQFRASRIEVALDEGHIAARPAGRRATLPVAELELELKQGRAADLTALALRIAGRGRDALALVPGTRGKAERGYRLAASTPAPPVKAAARGFVAALQPAMTTGAALRAIVAHGLHVLLGNTEALRSAHDAEYVHQARVALRRLRSALRQLDAERHGFPPRLARELQWIARVLGEARDGDVLVDHTLPLLATEVPPDLRVAAGSMMAHARLRRDAALDRARAALATPRFARCALELKAWVLNPPDPSARVTLAKAAPRVLDRAHRRLFEAAQFFAALPPERRHRVRILAKRLRYALDILSVALPAAAVKPYSDALAGLQDVLGELNDAAVVIGEVPRFTASRELLDHAQQWHDAHERPLLFDAEARLLALMESERPWRRSRPKRQGDRDAGEESQ